MRLHRLDHSTIALAKTLGLIAVLSGLVGACDGPSTPPTSDQPIVQTQPALDAMQKLRTGDLKGAIKDYSIAIAQNPQDADSYVNRGIAHNELGQNQQAIADYNAALKLKPDLIQAYYNRANAYNQLNQYKAAIADYSKVIDLDPEYAYAFANRGASYFELGQKKEAISDMEKAIQIFTNKNDQQNVNRLQTQLKKWQSAQKP